MAHVSSPYAQRDVQSFPGDCSSGISDHGQRRRAARGGSRPELTQLVVAESLAAVVRLVHGHLTTRRLVRLHAPSCPTVELDYER